MPGGEDERRLLAESVSRLLADQASPAHLRRFIAERQVDPALWRAMADLGLHGLLVPEADGGVGGSAADLLCVMAELGRRLAPVPYLQNVIALEFVVGTGGRHLPGEWVGRAVRGDARLSPLVDPATLEWALEPSGGGWSGWLPHAQFVDAVIVFKRSGSNVVGGIVPLGGRGARRKPVETTDLTWPVEEVKITSGVAARWRCARAAFERVRESIRRISHAAVCAEMQGGAEEVLRQTVEYAKMRVQFDRPIGTFQAVQHRMADMAVAIEGIRSYVGALASGFPDGGREGARRAAMAKAYVADAYRGIAESALQVFGGIGYTWEHEAHLYIRHAQRCAQLMGEPARLRAEHVRGLA